MITYDLHKLGWPLRAESGAGTARIEFDIIVGEVNSYLLGKSDHREFGRWPLALLRIAREEMGKGTE